MMTFLMIFCESKKDSAVHPPGSDLLGEGLAGHARQGRSGRSPRALQEKLQHL